MSPATVALKTTLDNFRRDFTGLAAFINRSWAENTEQSLRYKADFLQCCFDYPGASTALAPTIYSGADPVAFVAAFPRTVKLENTPLKLAIVTFLTVEPEHKKKGYGVVLWSELVSRLRDQGFDGMVNYCVSGSSMDQIIAGCCARLHIPTASVFSIGYISNLLPPRRTFGAFTDSEESDTFMSSFLQASQDASHNSTFGRVWGEDEARWQCEGRDAVVTAHIRGAKGVGVLTGYLAPLANSNGTNCLFVEDVLWSGLEVDERKTLLHAFLDRARRSGAEMATVPRCGYADLKPFAAAGFIRTRRVIQAYLSLWNGMPLPASVPSFYLDVL